MNRHKLGKDNSKNNSRQHIWMFWSRTPHGHLWKFLKYVYEQIHFK